MKKRSLLLSFLVLLVVLVSAVPLFAAQSLTFRMETEIPALDPQKSNSAPSFTIGYHVFDNLVRVHKGKLMPAAASKWSISPDGKTYTFTLRDAKWSDGKPVTAHDFEYGIKRLLNPQTAAEYAFAAYYIKGAQDYNLGKNKNPNSVGVKATNDKTLVINLTNPTPYFLAYLGYNCFAPAREDLVKKYGETYMTAANKSVFNGPFILKEWKHEQKKNLVKNPNYWNAKNIKLDNVEILVIADPTTTLNMFENGELGFADLPANLYKQYEAKGQARVFYNGATDWMKINVRKNPQKPWLSNADFRRAIGYAIDRESYCNISTKGLYTPSVRYVLPLVHGVKGDYGKEYPLAAYPVKGNIPKAKESLKKALTTLKISDPSKITVEYLIQDLDETRLMSEVIQQQLEKNLGIKVKIKLVTRKQRADMEQKRQYDAVYHGWMPDYDDPMTYMEIWQSDSSQNNSGYGNPQYDKLIRSAMVEKDAKKRMDTIFKAEKILLEDAPIIPLQIRRKAWLKDPRLQGLDRPLIGAEYDFMTASFK